MTTQTQLANYALAHLGEAKISDIDDPGSRAARACKQFLEQVMDETLRKHRWNCAIKRGDLSELTTVPNHGFARAFALPADYLRILEVNGEAWEASDEFFEVEQGKRLLTNEPKVRLRYVARIPVAEMDPLLQRATALQLAVQLAVPLTSKLDLQERTMLLYRSAIAEARQVDAIETSSRENRPMRRLMDGSPLIRSRFTTAQSAARLRNRFPTW